MRFWFIAQTGAIYWERPSFPTNYWVYEMPGSALGRVKLAVEQSVPGPGGLEYESPFLVWLGNNSFTPPSDR